MTQIVRGLLLWSLLIALAGCNRPTGAVLSDAEARAATLPETPPTTQQAISYLASDELEGRGVGTKGLDLAAAYIAGQFRAAGLQPLPAFEGYFQRFEMNTGASIEPATSLRLGGEQLALDGAFRPLSFSATGTFDAPVVFAGYGISSSKHGYDDYAGVDVNGKVALVFRFEPHNDQGKSRFVEKGYSEEATFKRKARVAAERGAVALLVVNPPLHHGSDAFVPFAGMFSEARAPIPVVQISVEAANALLAQAGVKEDLAALQAKIDGSGQPASVALAEVRAEGDVRIKTNRAPVMNVAGLVPGSGPLKDEYVVVGAHYDHVGKSRMFSSGGKDGEIHNGADDNASGTIAMLALARHFAADAAPRRSIVFVAFTAEEWGLIGSQRFVEHPPIPLERVVAMVNLDMVGRMRNQTLYIGGTGSGDRMETIVRAADEASPIVVKELGKGGFGPSDHMSFALKKIPVLFFFTGLHADYHRPTDDADKVNYDGLGQIVAFARDVVDELARGPRQQYVAAPGGFPHASAASGAGGGVGRVTLGVVPDYTSAESSDGVRITGTVPGSPADAAGLKDGDVIKRFGQRSIADLMDLSAALGDSRAGERVKLKIARDGKDVELEATLAERKE